MQMERKTLLTHCTDAPGLISKITNICYKHQLNIIHNNEFVDNTSGHFFMRTELEGYFNDETLLADLDQALPENTKRKTCRFVSQTCCYLGDKRSTLPWRYSDEKFRW